MRQTWRWFGPADQISLAEIRQTGAQGIVSALHHIASGEVWPRDEITARKLLIEGQAGAPTGLSWDVVESLPVSEAIKTQGPEAKAHFAAYRESLTHLAAAGIKTVCYNFMPVLDWTRTKLAAPLPHGGTTMAFDLVDFAGFDIHLLQRKAAQEDYGEALREAARARIDAMDEAGRKALTSNIVAGLPGANERLSLADVAAHLSRYDTVSPARLRQNLIDFLSEVAPAAEALGLRLCCHPDDPPFPLLGLPRVMSSLQDYKTVLEAVDSPANGATFCTGSLGVDAGFDPVAFIRDLGPKIHFVHLRNTTRHAPEDGGRCSFYEAEHLGGDTDMVATIRALLAEQARRKAEGRADWEIPMRPDHGQALCSDLQRPLQPGYPLVGRLRGLAELRGVMAALTE